MFGKNVLKVISALFVSTQLVSIVRGAALTQCGNVPNMGTECAGSSVANPKKYCINSDGVEDGKIFEIETGDSCAKRGTQYTTSGVVVFETADNNGGTKNTDGSGTIANFAAYRCSGSDDATVCERTYGYVKLGGYVCSIKEGTVNCPAVGEITDTCAEADIGGLCKDSTDIKLKLTATPDKTKKIDDDNGAESYMMQNVASNVFTNAESSAGANNPVNKNIIVEASENAIVLLSNSYDYCERAENVVVPTFRDFCTQGDGNNCQNIQECTNGLCKRAGLTCAQIGAGSGCTDGFYVSTDENGGSLQTDGTAGTLFSCTSSNCVVASADFKVGYYKFAGQSNKYITCSAVGACTAIDVTANKANCADDGVDVGDVINDNANTILCLDATENGGVILTDAGTTYNGNYFMNGVAGNVINTAPSKFVIVTVTKETVQLAAKEASNVPKYKYTSDVSKIYDARQSPEICSTNNVIVEYKHDSDDGTHNYYNKHVTHTN